MVVKQSFKFLNTLLEFGYYQSMLLFRFSKQIRRAIIILDSIIVMNFPAFRHWSAVSLFPNKDMLKDIAPLNCSWIVRFINKNITVATFNPTPSPGMRFFPFRAVPMFVTGFRPRGDKNTTSWAEILKCPFLFMPIFFDSRLAYFVVGLIILFIIFPSFFLGRPHTLIIPIHHIKVKPQKIHLTFKGGE